MDSPAPKRRRTSPRNAVLVNLEAQSTTPRDAPPRSGSSPSRPSFASPTRATLERYNPDILRRRESQPRRLRSSPDTHPSASRPATPDSTGSLTRAMRTQLELRSATRDDGATATSEGGSILRSPARRLGPSRTPTRPTPRPLPPPAPEEDDELLRVLSTRLQPGIPPGVLPEVTAPEPELPPTPEHPDPVVSTPPSGIHNTPSRRPKRNRALAEKLKSSSPLKQPPLRPPDLFAKGSLPLALQGKTIQAAVAPTEPTPSTAESRGSKPADPDANKKKLRDSLLAEISQLERDLDIAGKENERIRQARLSRLEPPLPSNGDEILDVLARHVLPPGSKPPTKPDPIEDWLASALNPIAFLPFSKPSASGEPPALPRPYQHTQAEQPDEENLPPPVSHHPLPMTATEALPYLQAFSPLTFTSHVSPLPPRAPFEGNSTSSSGTREPPLLQHHSIAASSAAPRRGLFAARIEMTVDTGTMAIVSLTVPRLDPAAEAELRPFINKVVGGGAGEGHEAAGFGGVAGKADLPRSSSSGLHNNISVLTWAMGEWLRVAVQRAKVWIVLEREVCAGKEALQEMVSRMRTGKAGGRKKKRRRKKRWVERVEDDRVDEEEEGEQDGGSDGEEGGESVDGMDKYQTADLLPYMGRTCMDLEIPVLMGGEKGGPSMLRVQWQIGFDWTGEAQGEFGILVGLPGKWHKHDERGHLSGLPKLFDELIQGGEEPLHAVRTVVCLLAGEQGA
ncbi:hypothetical protein VTI28DRAFT_8800 [Corynascus sepedonium]